MPNSWRRHQQVERKRELFPYKADQQKKPLSIHFLSFVIPCILLVSWQLVSTFNIIPAYQLPSPVTVVHTLIQLIKDGLFQTHLATTTLRVIGGVVVGTSVALILGVVVGFYTKAEKLFDPIIQTVRSIPGLAWVPLFILWMGIGELSKVLLIAVGVFFPVYLNVVGGILNVNRKWIEVGKIYNFSHFQLVKRIILPATLPSFFTGFRNGVGIGWMFIVAAEMMGASEGLGYLLVIGQNSSSPNIILASIVMFASMGKLSDMLIRAVERRILSWREEGAIGG